MKSVIATNHSIGNQFVTNEHGVERSYNLLC